MLDFETELEKLLSHETTLPPQCEFAEVAAAEKRLLMELTRKQSDVSLQIEEIYDMVKDRRALTEAAERERQEKDRLVTAVVEIVDFIEYFRAYAKRSGDEALKAQAESMWKNTSKILAGCGVFRFGEVGEPLNPRIHTVKADIESSYPRECVTEVLQSGYMTPNRLLRKAAVVVSRGREDTGGAYDSRDNAGDTPNEIADEEER